MSNKKSRDLALFILDIFTATEKIKEYVQPFKKENDFRHNSLHWDATIRQLEIIGEALNNLLEDPKFEAQSPQYFRKVVNFRNTISHGYFGIDTDEVWNVIHQHLDILIDDIDAILKVYNIDMNDAIESTISDYKILNDTLIIKYLEKLYIAYQKK